MPCRLPHHAASLVSATASDCTGADAIIGEVYPVGGRGGIRTHGGLAPTAVFKTAAFNHSATRPSRRLPYQAAQRLAHRRRSGQCARAWRVAGSSPSKAGRGPGKSTQARRLAERLGAAGREVVRHPRARRLAGRRGHPRAAGRGRGRPLVAGHRDAADVRRPPRPHRAGDRARRWRAAPGWSATASPTPPAPTRAPAAARRPALIAALETPGAGRDAART